MQNDLLIGLPEYVGALAPAWFICLSVMEVVKINWYKKLKGLKNNLENMDNQKKECCPKFDPAPWDGKILEWDNKRFIKGKVFTLFYMPINFGKVITKMVT